MTTYFLADSIRVSNHETKLPGDIGRFRPMVREHALTTFVGADGKMHASLPFGSTCGPHGSAEAALRAGHESMLGRGWVTDRSVAEAGAIEHARARRNSHPNR